jgi:hypothetical protein
MSERLSFGIGWAHVIRESEAQAAALKRAAPPGPWGDEQATYEWWVSTLGVSEIEFRRCSTMLAADPRDRGATHHDGPERGPLMRPAEDT